jgi:transcriptional regulator with XRE-family HTH domain
MNELKLNLQKAIKQLRLSGWSHRDIAAELGIDRGTVGKYLRLEAKSANEVPAGSGLLNSALSPLDHVPDTPPKPAKVPAGSPVGSKSKSAHWS